MATGHADGLVDRELPVLVAGVTVPLSLLNTPRKRKKDGLLFSSNVNKRSVHVTVLLDMARTTCIYNAQSENNSLSFARPTVNDVRFVLFDRFPLPPYGVVVFRV